MRLVMFTVWGMYKAYPEILNNIELPEEMDKDTMLDYIFMYAGGNETRYSDPLLMERLVKRWFSARKHDFSMMWRALHAEYNPIENTDRYEDYWRTYDRTGSGKEERNGNQISELTGKTSGTGNTSGTQTRTPNLTAEETTSAFDSEAYQPYKKRVDTGSEDSVSTENTNSSANSTQNSNVTEKSNIARNESLKDEEKHGLHSHGNIGVTTNQEMINQELELRRYDLYKQIALLFEDEFTIPVYERRCNEYGLL